MKTRLLLLFVLCAFTAGSIRAQFIMISTEGSKQGKFKGESTRSKFNDRSELAGYLMEVLSPRDAGTGQATGRRVFQPVVLLKATGGSSPQYMQALAQNEVLKRVVIDFYKADAMGVEVNYYSITLENVSVAGYKQFTGPLDNEKFNPTNNNILYDEIRLVYQKITVEDKINKTMMTDESNLR